jgi:hypothetical protein
MSELVSVEEYPDFSAASNRAKRLAIQFKERTGIQRIETGWTVLVSNSVATVLVSFVEDEAAEYEDYSSNLYDDEYQHEVVQPFIEEFQSDQDDWARLEEEGWFYKD